MPQYIAFLRGINVGGHRVKMERLREIFEETGLSDVSTFIASGNVVFSAESRDVARLKADIENRLEEALGYEVATFIRSRSQLATLSAADPADAQHEEMPEASSYVILLGSTSSPEIRTALASLTSDTDSFRFSGTEIFWRIRGKLSESPLFGKGMEGALRGTPNTMRNMNTLRRWAAKLAGSERGTKA